jgi:hypothetical protein
MHWTLLCISELLVYVHPMLEEEPCLVFIVLFDRLDQSIGSPPLLKMLFLHVLVDYFVADLALGRVAVALDRMHNHLLVREKLVAVRTLYICNLNRRCFLGRFLDNHLLFELVCRWTNRSTINSASESSSTEASPTNVSDPASFFFRRCSIN